MRAHFGVLLLVTSAPALLQGWVHGGESQWVFLRAAPDTYLKPHRKGFDPYQGPKPLVVFIETEPQLLVLGADMPRVVLYDNGQLIVHEPRGKRAANGDVVLGQTRRKGTGYTHRTLSKEEMDAFQKRISPIFAVKDLKPFYTIAPNTTNVPVACFYFRRGTREVITKIHGLALLDRQAADRAELGIESTEKLPGPLVDAHRFLGSLDHRPGVEWAPRYVEVMLWPWGKTGPNPAAEWPKDWPDLQSERAVRGRNLLVQEEDEFYSVFLDAQLLPRVREVLTLKFDAVHVGGRKWMFDHRYVFPGEPAWRRPFNREMMEAFSRHER